MISWLDGTVVGSIRTSLIVAVGGVGYEVVVTGEMLSKCPEGTPVTLFTHHAVRETASDLFGFATRDELMWFQLLLTVSGIGPKSAMQIMNSADVGSLKAGVASGDAGRLVAAFGLSKKTAEKLVLELRDKVAELGTDSDDSPDADVVDALQHLGYTLKEAQATLKLIPRSITDTEGRIREAIKISSRS